ncbi:hypothetical protein Cgig2_022700 [Carnegiea gigantea]|uniref:Uncharacterized protein n=1 Tax=Carnegiea gigantea TaxID=171969 RepID=A0A9Q1JSD1_9CARY|nr:hypothetical protein Cgig2_022700 [Carnegiea gigantea]
MDDHISKERARQRTGRTDMRMYWNYVSVIIKLCKQNNTPESGVELPNGSNRGHKREDPIKEKLVNAWVRNDTSRVTCDVICAEQVWFYKSTNLYAHVDEKCMTRIVMTQKIPTPMRRMHRAREALWVAKEALTLEKVAYAAIKKELEHMRALLMGRGRG